MASTVDILKEVLAEAHTGHKYVKDIHNYGKDEYWQPDLKGDCEDFALWCKYELEKKGIDADLVLAQTETGGYHLVCSVDGWVLDNRYRYLVSKDELRYKWLKIGRNGVWYKLNADEN